MALRFHRALVPAVLAMIGLGIPAAVMAADVTFSGTITYPGPYQGDTLFVAVLDTSDTEDVTFLALGAFAVGAPPFSQPFALTFDNSTAPATAAVASFLDVDGGGVDSVSAVDILGWYGEGSFPQFVSTAASANGLDFALPTAEIHGTITLGAGQTSASIRAGSQCLSSNDFRPSVDVVATGPYSMVGIYPGTWCVAAYGFFSGPPYFAAVCHGDPDCVSPTLITLSAGESVTGVDLDFSGIVPVRETSWGLLKTRHR